MTGEGRKDRLFLDADVLVAGAISPPGGSGYILLLGEMESVEILVCEQVLAEARRALKKKAPRALSEFERIIQAIKPQVCPEPTVEEIILCREIIHPDDAPILAAAMKARPDSLITLNTHHFIDDPRVKQRSGLRIETPGMYLARFRQQLGEKIEEADARVTEIVATTPEKSPPLTMEEIDEIVHEARRQRASE